MKNRLKQGLCAGEVVIGAQLRFGAPAIAELFGKATGCSQGRGGSMHLFSPEVGMMGTSGIVGPCILPID